MKSQQKYICKDLPLENGERVKQYWLLYSISIDSIYYFGYMLFSADDFVFLKNACLRLEKYRDQRNIRNLKLYVEVLRR